MRPGTARDGPRIYTPRARSTKTFSSAPSRSADVIGVEVVAPIGFRERTRCGRRVPEFGAALVRLCRRRGDRLESLHPLAFHRLGHVDRALGIGRESGDMPERPAFVSAVAEVAEDR